MYVPGRVGVADPEPDLLPPCGELLPPLPPPDPDPPSDILAPNPVPLPPLDMLVPLITTRGGEKIMSLILMRNKMRSVI